MILGTCAKAINSRKTLKMTQNNFQIQNTKLAGVPATNQTSSLTHLQTVNSQKIDFMREHIKSNIKDSKKTLREKSVGSRVTNKEKNIIERAAAEENLNTGDLILKAISFYITFKKVEPTFNDMLEYCQSNPLMLLKLEDLLRFQNMKLLIKEGLKGKGRAIK